ncbi:hypothetical protein CYMTET_13474, partial [Cymbomonas tetramitiformis]
MHLFLRKCRTTITSKAPLYPLLIIPPENESFAQLDFGAMTMPAPAPWSIPTVPYFRTAPVEDILRERMCRALEREAKFESAHVQKLRKEEERRRQLNQLKKEQVLAWKAGQRELRIAEERQAAELRRRQEQAEKERRDAVRKTLQGRGLEYAALKAQKDRAEAARARELERQESELEREKRQRLRQSLRERSFESDRARRPLSAMSREEVRDKGEQASGIGALGRMAHGPLKAWDKENSSLPDKRPQVPVITPAAYERLCGRPKCQPQERQPTSRGTPRVSSGRAKSAPERRLNVPPAVEAPQRLPKSLFEDAAPLPPPQKPLEAPRGSPKRLVPENKNAPLLEGGKVQFTTKAVPVL